MSVEDVRPRGQAMRKVFEHLYGGKMVKILYKGIKPERATALASGLDLKASKEQVIHPQEVKLVDTDLWIALPAGYEAQVRSRSGLTLKRSIWVANAPGTIDADYRGEVKVMLFNGGQERFDIAIGDRIAQLVIAPVCLDTEFEIVSVLPASDRGEGGFGSTGMSETLSKCEICGRDVFEKDLIKDRALRVCLKCSKG